MKRKIFTKMGKSDTNKVIQRAPGPRAKKTNKPQVFTYFHECLVIDPRPVEKLGKNI